MEQTGAVGGNRKVPVTMRALLQRINRALKKEREQLKRTRGGMQAFLDLGDFWIHDWNGNAVARSHVDPEELGRKLGVLHEWEQVVP
jgi:hypothetical protein